MQTARRLYVYLISGVGMGMLVAGLTILLSVLFDRLGLGGTVLGGEGDVIGQQLTLASALIVVGLPVWLIHWLAAERSVRPDRPGAALERTSDVRGLYFALALGILLAVAASGVSVVIQAIADELIEGPSSASRASPAGWPSPSSPGRRGATTSRSALETGRAGR